MDLGFSQCAGGSHLRETTAHAHIFMTGRHDFVI